MIVSKGVGLKKMIGMSGHHMSWLLVFSGGVGVLYWYDIVHFFLPWAAITVIGTAVAFYVGFKNNQSYDRLWEARKIWGAIVNSSRAWGMYVKAFVTNGAGSEKISDEELKTIHQKIIYRHIAWLYALRSQLLVTQQWEHVGQSGSVGKYARYYQKYFGVGMVDDEVTKVELHEFLPADEYERLVNYVNTATQIIDQQSQDLKDLHERGLVDNFRHVELEKVLYHFYEHQGKCERIKKFPFPRQYANMSRYFVGIFIVLLPFSIIPEFMTLGPWGFWLSIPVTALIGWVYVMMEIVGDYSESPFQGMANDIPMLSLCRTIEIDLREMLGETDLPEPIKAKRNILM